jgi:hypothetical protein
MKLYFNGCSFTYGDELANPTHSSWPALVSSRLDLPYTNDAVSGGTNERTLHLVLNQADSHDYFFIAWTSYTRFTEYNPVDNFEINFNPQLNLDPKLHLSDDLQRNFVKYKQYGEMFYRHWFNELYELKKWLQQIILLQCFFQCRDKSYLMLNTFDNSLSRWLQPWSTFNKQCRDLISFFDCVNDDQLWNQHQEIQYLNNQIDHSRFIDWATWCIRDLDQSYPRGTGGHILESGHSAVADIVLQRYNTKI